jgi:hypothetical protein
MQARRHKEGACDGCARRACVLASRTLREVMRESADRGCEKKRKQRLSLPAVLRATSQRCEP